jgi:hypothetical protein
MPFSDFLRPDASSGRRRTLELAHELREAQGRGRATLTDQPGA